MIEAEFLHTHTRKTWNESDLMQHCKQRTLISNELRLTIGMSTIVASLTKDTALKITDQLYDRVGFTRQEDNNYYLVIN